ncbi:hypothetical protein DFH28DRAFT_357644 [Melampsora americana]|nr:hypothetical protein DFH28DRAFT_357644 [Melampsora americana]
MFILNRFPISLRRFVSSAITSPNRLAFTHRGQRIHSTLSFSTALSTKLDGLTNAHPHYNHSARYTTLVSSAQSEPSLHPTSSTPTVLHSKLSSSRIPVQTTAFSFTSHSDHLRVKFANGQSSNFHYIWLRDNCRCSECFHPYTKQRLLDTFQLPLDISPRKVNASKEDKLEIEWSDGHITVIPVSFLKQYSYDPPIKDDLHSVDQSERTLWDRSVETSTPSVQFESLFLQGEAGERAILEWLRNIDRFGFCLVDGVPLEPVMTEKLLCRIAFIRETHYGAFWDFTADMEHGDTAYTNLPLGAHTDTTYFSDPAGLQLFHLLSPVESHSGGMSLLVDGFAVASRLKELHPWAYETLSQVPVDSHASGGEGVALRPLLPSPVLTHHPRSGELVIIRWNPDDRRPLRTRNGAELKRWYCAVREWEKILKSSEMEFWMQMKQGQALIFDNQRVLHGRSGFTGSRRLCGGYINGDDYRSRLRSLEDRFRKQASTSSSTDVWHEIE